MTNTQLSTSVHAMTWKRGKLAPFASLTISEKKEPVVSPRMVLTWDLANVSSAFFLSRSSVSCLTFAGGGMAPICGSNPEMSMFSSFATASRLDS